MPESLEAALAALRPLLLDPDGLVRAVAAGRQRGRRPTSRRVELRPVDLKAGRCLQVVSHGDAAPRTRNEAYGEQAAAAVDDLLGQPFGNWHVQTTDETVQLRVTKKGQAQVHRGDTAGEQQTRHDRDPRHLIDPGDPLFKVLGAGAGKRRQVDAFLRQLARGLAAVEVPTDRPLRVVDLGCGNAYLTFAAYHFLSDCAARDELSGAGPAMAPGAADKSGGGAADNSGGVELIGVDLREEARRRNTGIAAELGWSDRVRFEAGSILDAPVDRADVVIALHACDTATDDALAQAVRWRAPLVLAAPCCHHDLQRQLQGSAPPGPYALVTRHGILRERLADVLTDSLRAALLRRAGYRVEVVQFVAAEHTPRNTMIVATRTGAEVPDEAVREYDELVAAWGVTPYLQTLLADVRP